MDIIIILAYLAICLLSLLIFKTKLNVIFLSPIIITSGSVYISAVISIIIVIYLYTFKLKIRLKDLVIFLFITVFLVFTAFFQKSYNYNFLEFFQLLCFIFLFGQMLTYRNSMSKLDIKSINIGFYLGSLVIIIALFLKSGISLILAQQEFNYFSISGTFNYTAYFLFFGLIGAPHYLGFNNIKRFLIFGLFLIAMFIFESRAALILGVLFFTYLNYPKTRIKKWLIFVPMLCLSIYVIINSGFVDQKNQNDLLSSAVNFKDNTSNLERVYLIQSAFSSMIDTPLGWGVGKSNSAISYYGSSVPHAHNLISNWMFELGLIGNILSLFFFISLYLMYRVKRDKYGVAIVLFIAMYSMTDTLQYNVLMSLTTLLALITLSSNKDDIKYKKTLQ